MQRYYIEQLTTIEYINKTIFDTTCSWKGKYISAKISFSLLNHQTFIGQPVNQGHRENMTQEYLKAETGLPNLKK
jgi:hypothetical protein